MYDLATLMNKYPKLHVTTKGDYIFEFDRVCRYKYNLEQGIPQKQYLPTAEDASCTHSRYHISSSRFFLQSGSMNPYDVRNYRDRYQNFNTIYTEIGTPLTS